jgi:hypothetical protein
MVTKRPVKKVKKPKYNRPKRIGKYDSGYGGADAAEDNGGAPGATGADPADAGTMFDGYGGGGSSASDLAAGATSSFWTNAEYASHDPAGYAAGAYGGSGGRDMGQVGSPSFEAAYYSGYEGAAANAPSGLGISALHDLADAAGRNTAFNLTGTPNFTSTHAGGIFGGATINEMVAGRYGTPIQSSAISLYGGKVDDRGNAGIITPAQMNNRGILSSAFSKVADPRMAVGAAPILNESLRTVLGDRENTRKALIQADLDMKKSDKLRDVELNNFLTTRFDGSGDIGRYAQLGTRDNKTGIITYVDNISFGRGGESGALARSANLVGILSTIPGAVVPNIGTSMKDYKDALANANAQIADRAIATQRALDLSGDKDYRNIATEISNMSTKDIYTAIGSNMLGNPSKGTEGAKFLSDPDIGTKGWTDKVAEHVGNKTGVNPLTQAKADIAAAAYSQTQGLINVALPGGVKVLANGQIANPITGDKLGTGAYTVKLKDGGTMTIGAGKTVFDNVYTMIAWTGKGDPNEGKFAYTIDKATGQPMPTAANVQLAEAFKSSIGSGGTVAGNNIGTISPVTGMVWSGSNWVSPETFQRESPNTISTTKQSVPIALGILPQNAAETKPLYSNIYNYWYDPYINPKDDPKQYENPRYNPLTLGHNEPFVPGISGLNPPAKTTTPLTTILGGITPTVKTQPKKKNNYDWMTLREQLGIPVSIGVYGKKKVNKHKPKTTPKKQTVHKNADDQLMDEILYGKTPTQKKPLKKPVKKIDYLNCGI